jgi:hypothetical protein
VARTIALLDELLTSPALREAGALTAFPQGNQVLLKLDGYRQLTTAAAAVESSLGLDVTADDPLAVSRRGVDALYERWCFVQLARQLGRLCGRPVERELFEVDERGLTLRFRQGAGSELAFERTVGGGRRVEARLFFNLTFSGERVWTRPLRPDCSLRLRAERPAGAPAREWWIHFDAKYRVRAAQPRDDAGDGSQPRHDATVVDLQKLHAYRDGIRGTAGAFVLFPGDGELAYRLTSDEPLPALGAFPLRPGGSGAAARRLHDFLADAFEHVADQATRLERARWWSERAYDAAAPTVARPSSSAVLPSPPADTAVLVGYVRSVSQRRWIARTGYYNVRGGERRGALRPGATELDAKLLLLYGETVPALYRRVSPWQAVSRETMRRRGYPQPRGDAYHCCRVRRVARQPDWIASLDLDRLRGGARTFRPLSVSWLDLLREAARVRAEAGSA